MNTFKNNKDKMMNDDNMKLTRKQVVAMKKAQKKKVKKVIKPQTKPHAEKMSKKDNKIMKKIMRMEEEDDVDFVMLLKAEANKIKEHLVSIQKGKEIMANLITILEKTPERFPEKLPNAKFLLTKIEANSAILEMNLENMNSDIAKADIEVLMSERNTEDALIAAVANANDIGATLVESGNIMTDVYMYLETDIDTGE